MTGDQFVLREFHLEVWNMDIYNARCVSAKSDMRKFKGRELVCLSFDRRVDVIPINRFKKLNGNCNCHVTANLYV